jgi:hypothetical protein
MPDFDSTHVDSLLTNIAVQYPLPQGMVGDIIFPRVPVSKESGIYFRYNKGDRARIPFTLRALKSESRRVGWRVDTDSYKCEEYALHDLIDDREYQQADAPLDLQRDTIENLQNLLRLDKEKRIQALATDTGVVTKNNTLTGTDQWRDAGTSGSTSDPVGDFEVASEAIRADTGVRPNVAIFGMEAWLAFHKNQTIVDKIVTPGGSWGSPTITTEHARTLLAPYGITRVVVADSIENTAGYGVTDSFSDIWTDEVFIAYIEPRPGIKKVSFGYTFMSRDWQVRRARAEREHSDWFEPSYVSDEKIVAADVGYVLADVSDGT